MAQSWRMAQDKIIVVKIYDLIVNDPNARICYVEHLSERIFLGESFDLVNYNEGIPYLPKLPIQQDWIDKVKSDRQFVYEVLCKGHIHNSLDFVQFVTKKENLLAIND